MKILSAPVSLVINTVNSIEAFTEDEFTIDVDESSARIHFYDKEQAFQKKVSCYTEFVDSRLQRMEDEQYTEFIDIIFEEVKNHVKYEPSIFAHKKSWFY